jgi:hypothetical protein
MCRDGRFSLPRPTTTQTVKGWTTGPTRNADDDAKTYESIECPACSRVHLVKPARAVGKGSEMATVSAGYIRRFTIRWPRPIAVCPRRKDLAPMNTAILATTIPRAIQAWMGIRTSSVRSVILSLRPIASTACQSGCALTSPSCYAAANFTGSINFGSSESAFELLTRFDTGQR